MAGRVFEIPLSDNCEATGPENMNQLNIFKYLSGDQVSRFIKKTLKIYKALRVLERNKSSDTPFFSKSIEKLIRYFSKKFPDHCGLHPKSQGPYQQSPLVTPTSGERVVQDN